MLTSSPHADLSSQQLRLRVGHSPCLQPGHGRCHPHLAKVALATKGMKWCSRRLPETLSAG